MTTFTEKKCTGPCGLVKPIDEFYIRNNRPSGHQSRCKVCQSQAGAEQRQKNPDYKKQYDQKNSKIISAYCANLYRNNRESILKKQANYRKLNPEIIRAYCAKHRAAKLKRMVAWADLNKIKEVYADCEEVNLAASTAGCTEKFVVDHVIPLQGKFVSGLHIETNLQIITASDNLTKGNKFIPG